MDYILITPAKNEEMNLPLLVESIMSQTIPPKAWIIVDDGSTDNTGMIAQKLTQRHTWIHYSRLEREIKDTRTIRDFEIDYPAVIIAGLTLAQQVCDNNRISYNFIGKIDADMLLACNYFETMLSKFQYNPRLGVAGGCAPGQTVRSNPMPGGAYLIRRECLEQLGNLAVEYDIDAIMSIKARLRGWEARIFDDAHFVHEGQRSLWSARRHGFKAYVLRKPPLALAWYLAQPFLTGRLQEIPVFLYGYLSALFGREERVTDRDVKYYYSHVYSKELVKTISERIKRRFARNPKLSAPGSD